MSSLPPLPKPTSLPPLPKPASALPKLASAPPPPLPTARAPVATPVSTPRASMSPARSDGAAESGSPPSVIIDWRHAPTVRIELSQPRPRRLELLRTYWKELASGLAVAVLVLWVSPHLLSDRPKLGHASGTVEILGSPAAPSIQAASAMPSETQLGASEPRVGSADSGAQSDGDWLKPTSTRKRPRREAVRRALRAVSADVAACVPPRASLRVRVTFVGASGHAVRTKLLGAAPPEAAACVARAVQRARVPAFGSRRIVVEHTFSR